MILATDSWTVVGALGAAVGGIGAAVGGVAAWRAASASRATSRDALEALGLALVPTLSADSGIDPKGEARGRGDWWARVFNTSAQLAATQLHFEASFRDGHRVEAKLERLGPGEHWTVALREIGMPPGGPTEAEAGQTAVLRYSDERGILRYELRFGFIAVAREGVTQHSISMIPTSEALRI